MESYENAKRYVYGPLDGSQGPAQITEEYLEASGEFVRSQLALGGYRLADLIEEVLMETTENLENTQGFVHKQLRRLKLVMM
jgi:DNA mismatch repair protein MutH